MNTCCRVVTRDWVNTGVREYESYDLCESYDLRESRISGVQAGNAIMHAKYLIRSKQLEYLLYIMFDT